MENLFKTICYVDRLGECLPHGVEQPLHADIVSMFGLDPFSGCGRDCFSAFFIIHIFSD